MGTPGQGRVVRFFIERFSRTAVEAGEGGNETLNLVVILGTQQNVSRSCHELPDNTDSYESKSAARSLNLILQRDELPADRSRPMSSLST